MTRTVAPLTWLYVPGARPDRFDKAAASGADVVIVDLEDSVIVSRKDEARAACQEWVSARSGAPAVEVRINAVTTAAGRADLAALVDVTTLRALRVPKTECADDVLAVVEATGGRHRVQCIVESALGVENAYEIARSSPQVCGIGLGEADLASDLGVHPDDGLHWARARLVVAARAAGLPAPAMSVFAGLDDQDGLRAHCAAGRRLGFLGCAAVHPRQLPVIREVFAPTTAEVDAARAVLDALDAVDATGDGDGAVRTADGRMVDPAMRRRAEQTIALGGDARP